MSSDSIVHGSKSIRCSNVPPSPARSRAIIHPCSMTSCSTTRPSDSVARQTAVYFRLGAPCSTRYLRQCSGRTLARRFRGGVFECIGAGARYNPLGALPMSSPSTRERRPTWEVADICLPYQGDWTVEEYLKLDTNRLIEFTDGFLEFLPMPEEIHYFVQNFIFAAVEAFLRTRGKGEVRYAPFKVRVREGAFREPDVCVLLD